MTDTSTVYSVNVGNNQEGYPALVEILDSQAIRKLPLKLNILGAFVVLRNSNSLVLTTGEIVTWLIENKALTTENIRVIENNSQREQRELCRLGLMFSLTQEEAKKVGVKLPKTAKRVYGITPAGEEVMRFVNPYLDFFVDEVLVPVSFYEANKRLKVLFGRRKFFGLQKMKETCIVRQIGKLTLVLKRLAKKEATKVFTEFPYIGMDDFVRYLKRVNISLTDEMIQLLKQIFGDKEKVEWTKISYMFRHKK